MHILGQTGVVHYRNLRVWAENGLVHVEDKKTGAYQAHSVRTAAERISALSDMLGHSRAEMRRSGNLRADMFDYIQNGVARIYDVCKQAQQQGDPDDPATYREAVRRRPCSVVMSSSPKAAL